MDGLSSIIDLLSNLSEECVQLANYCIGPFLKYKIDFDAVYRFLVSREAFEHVYIHPVKRAALSARRTKQSRPQWR